MGKFLWKGEDFMKFHEKISSRPGDIKNFRWEWLYTLVPKVRTKDQKIVSKIWKKESVI